MSARQVVAYEYDCDACGKPLVDPEWETPFYVKAADDGSAPDLGDYDLDTVEAIDVAGSTRYVHNSGDTDCWHWCQDGEEQGIGPADACPNKGSHEDAS